MRPMSRSLLASACLMALSVTIVGVAQADMTKEEAAKYARAKRGGKVLSVEAVPPSNESGAPAEYRVKLLVEGSVVIETVTEDDKTANTDTRAAGTPSADTAPAAANHKEVAGFFSKTLRNIFNPTKTTINPR